MSRGKRSDQTKLNQEKRKIVADLESRMRADVDKMKGPLSERIIRGIKATRGMFKAPSRPQYEIKPEEVVLPGKLKRRNPA